MYIQYRTLVHTYTSRKEVDRSAFYSISTSYCFIYFI